MKNITIVLLVLISFTAKSQPFVGMALNTNSAEMHAGYAFNQIELTATYKVPFSGLGFINIASLNISKAYHFSDSLYYVRAGVGIANYNRYNISVIAPNYRSEIGRRYQQGTLFLLIDYCKNIFIMAGLKIYIK